MEATPFKERFRQAILDLLDESFDNVQGAYLDRGTSLFETLATISAAEASIPVSATCASIAAQVEHVRFYLDVLEQFVTGKNPGKVDWGEIWRTIEKVTPDEWEASKARLRASYNRIIEVVKTNDWEDDDALGGGIALIAHTAYHLGEIRQATCTIRNRA